MDIQIKEASASQALTVTVATQDTNVVDHEQLEELHRANGMFLEVADIHITENTIHLSYHLDNSRQALVQLHKQPLRKKLAVLHQLLQVVQYDGTQFIPYLDPNNIFFGKDYSIKIAHRGLRGILPPMEETDDYYFAALKACFLSLFSSYSYQTILSNGSQSLLWEESTIAQQIAGAESLEELKRIVEKGWRTSSDKSGTVWTKTQILSFSMLFIFVGILIGVFGVLAVQNDVFHLSG
ncbi:type VII secretion protein EssB/YukC [Pontibacillus salicampi]|uniref:Type VII secretion protein EssB/YukC n=1 Tax=Pontibacillus salicampi TaxID=1449801 RepID=A0ABV6LUE6_9BACI